MSEEILIGTGIDQILLIEETIGTTVEVDQILMIEEITTGTGIVVDQILLIEDGHRDITPRPERTIGL